MKLNEDKVYTDIGELSKDIQKIEKLCLFLWFFGIFLMFAAVLVTIMFNIEIAGFLWFLFGLYMLLMFKLAEKRSRLIGQQEDLKECQSDMSKFN